MKPVQIKCELINVRERKDGRLGSSIILKEIINNNCHEIVVDESVNRVKTRLLEQYDNGESKRDGIYLSRMMTNIDINTKGDTWDINQEDWNWYTFSKHDVRNLQ